MRRSPELSFSATEVAGFLACQHLTSLELRVAEGELSRPPQSSADDAPRGLEFLFSLNRLNVAVSRAQALCVLVASPELTRASCKTPRQMKLVNALCAYLERVR